MASNQETTSDLDEILTCSVCLEVLKQPYTLKECLHSFCKPCLDGLNRKVIDNQPGVECPLCWEFSCEDSIKSNFFIGSLLDAHAKTKKSEKLECGCTSKAEPKYRCTDCKMNICEKCKESHLFFPLLQNHQIVPLEENADVLVDKLVFCNIHHDEPVKFNCKECEVLLCIKCKVIDHESHKTETVETALERLLPEITGNKDKIENNLDEMKEDMQEIEKKISETKDAYSATCMDIKDKALEQIRAIQENENSLLKQITMKENEELSKLENIKRNLTHRIKTCQNLRSLVNASISNARHTSLLSEFQGGLYQMVKTYSSPAKKSTIKIDYPRFNATKIPPDILGEVTYQSKISIPRNTQHLSNHQITEVEDVTEFLNSPNWHKAKEMVIDANCNRMAMIDGNLWFPCYKQHIIKIYNTGGNILKTLNLQEKMPRAVVKKKNEDTVIFACQTTGLFEMTKEGQIVDQITTGTFCDVLLVDNGVFALNFREQHIHQFQPDNKGNLIQTKLIKMDNIPCHKFSTILLIGEKILLSSFYNKSIFVLSLEGQLIQTLVTPVSRMSLCMNDSNGKFCFASYNSHCLYTCDGDDTYNIVQCAKGQRRPVDVIKDGDNSLWVLLLGSMKAIQYKKLP